MIGDIAPDRVLVAEHFGEVPVEPGGYERIVRSFSDVRRREFMLGRYCAHGALRRLGAPPAVVPIGAAGAPAWPTGVIGSITHADGYGAAAVAWASDYLAIGIDAERLGAVSAEVWPVLFTPAELRRLGQAPDPRRLATQMFGAKESTFKCLGALNDRVSSFLDFEVEFDAAAAAFTPWLRKDIDRPLPARGWAACLGSLAFTLCVIPA